MIGRTGVGAVALSPVPNQTNSKSYISHSPQKRASTVGNHRSMRMPLPDDPQEALDEMVMTSSTFLF